MLSNRYKVQVMTHSGYAIELDEEFKIFSDASDRASLITLQGLRVCLTADGMSYIPAQQISSVFVEDLQKEFVPNAAVVTIKGDNDSAQCQRTI